MGNEPGWGVKVLIGAIFFFVPVLHILSLGYLLRYGRRIRAHNDLALPEWNDWGALFMDGLRMLVIWFCFFCIPVGIGFGLSMAFDASMPFLGVINTAWWAFPAAGWLIGCYLYMAALYRFIALESLDSLLDLKTIFRMAHAMRWQLALPILMFTGLLTLFWPIYGFVFFMGFLILTAYSSINYLLMERAAGINR